MGAGREKAFVILLCVAFLWSATVFAQEVPQGITYQGRLEDSGGNPVDGLVSMEFKITDLQVEEDSVEDKGHVLIGVIPTSLDFDDLLTGSEVVTDLTGTITYVYGTDYNMDYLGGTITRIESGSISNPGAVLVDYDYNTDIQELWSESKSVLVDEGVFNVILGRTSPIPHSVFDGVPRYLEVNVEGETLLPRKPLSSVAFAMKANTVASGSVGPTELAANAVTSDKIDDGSVTGDMYIDSTDGNKLKVYDGSVWHACW